MNVQMTPRVHEKEIWNQGAGRATAILASAAEDARHPLSANWDVSQDDPQNPMLTLEVADPWDAVRDKFTPGDLADGDRLWFRIYRLYGKLLMASMDRILHNLEDGENGAS